MKFSLHALLSNLYYGLNKDLKRIIISIILFIISFFIPESFKVYVLLLSYIIISYELYIEAFEALKEKDFFNENTLMILATLGAFIIKEYNEAIMVILLYTIGEYLSDLAVEKSKNSIKSLLDVKSKVYSVLNERDEEEYDEEDGYSYSRTKLIEAEHLKKGMVLELHPGDRIPVDGIAVGEEDSFVDTSAITGESTPRKVSFNDEVLSGYIVLNSVMFVEVTTSYKNSTATRIIEMLEEAEDSKSDTEKFITKFARIYTPIVVLLALLIIVIPSLITHDLNTWLYRGLVFLVTSCPCALVLSVPLGYFVGIGVSSRNGLVLKGSNILDKLSNIDNVLLDKTGTITEGVFEIVEVNTNMKKEEDFINMIASAESKSNHPIATAVLNKNEYKLKEVSDYEEISGKGIKCRIRKDEVLVGNNKLLDDYNIKYEKVDKVGTVVYLVINNEYKGYIIISDKIKENNKDLSILNNNINKDIIILSGDNNNIVEDIAKKVGIKKFFGDLLPLDKVDKVKEYKKKGTTIFVGDGINDAPSLKIADIGISIGNIASDAAIETSDAILLGDNLNNIAKAIKISKTTKRKVKTSIICALLIKIIILILSVFGYSSILLAVFADVGVTILSVLYVLTVALKKY